MSSEAPAYSQPQGKQPRLLSWSKQDIERRLAFPGSPYTQVSTPLSAILALLLTVGFYASLLPFQGSEFAAMFTDRGWVPYAIAYFSAWSLAILFLKWRKLRLQQRALRIHPLPEVGDFVLSTATVGQVVELIHRKVEDPKRFIVFNRILIALSNLRNLGRIGDLDDILRSQAEHDASAVETSYSLLHGFVWAIPVLGFIGTVLGLSQAIGGFGAMLDQTDDMSQLIGSLQSVTGGLSIAFQTTLIGLVAALAIQLLLTFLKKSEEEFLEDCLDYCVLNIVGKLRVMPFELDTDEASA